ncbi:MAG: hypothetical protein ABSH36_02285 [Solirubrobacteraceae bacterium]
MSRVEDLTPDLRAVLSLLVGRHQRYGEIATLLSIEERAVHDRAHAALALLAPRRARELSASQREQVGEYLLGQAPPVEQSAAVAYLESSAAARAWARALAIELAPLSTDLPSIPQEPPLTAASSRRGGALLLGGLAVVVVVAVALIVSLGGGSSPSSATTSSTPSESGGSTSAATSTASTTSSTSTTSGKSGSDKSGSGKSGSGKASEPHLSATLALTPPNNTSKALGLVEVIAEGNEHAFILAAEHLPPTNGFHYAAWLYNTPTDAYFLGGGTTVSSKGTLKAAQALPTNAAHYATIILTEEHEERPKQPGPIVLSGNFKLG